MENPFLKRATEYLRDHEAFLAIVSPEPIRHFLVPFARSGELYDRLVIIEGTPGSGKTTLASLFEYPRLAALARTPNAAVHEPLLEAMRSAGAIREGVPALLGCRIPLESGYRALWEFPYPIEVRLGICGSLIQARAVLAWLRSLTQAGHKLESITIVPRGDAGAGIEAIGGLGGASIQARARDVERVLYKVAGALVPPKLSDIDAVGTAAYSPFDVIDGFVIDAQGVQQSLKPLVILDDAQSLAPDQFDGIRRWLARREVKLARWVITRLDVLPATEALSAVTEVATQEVALPGLSAKREICSILFQGGDDRRQQRAAFRRTAVDMAGRYMHHMPLFARRKLVDLSDLLAAEPEALSRGDFDKLRARVQGTAAKLKIAARRESLLKAAVDSYAPSGQHVPEEVQLAMLNVLLHRYANRVPQAELFGATGEELDREPSRPLVADVQVHDAARMHLLHEYERPYYCGIDDVCDASSENAEQFLHLAAGLVELIAANMIRGKSAVLSARTQHQQLRKKAGEVFASWDFPRCDAVRNVVTAIGTRCVEASRAANGWLGAGANAYGILQDQFDRLPADYPELAEVLKFAVAYNAVGLVPRYNCKNRMWCLIELGGIPKLRFGLTLKRGGFLEGDIAALARFVRSEAT